ncbi:chemotaxis protein CheD [Pseudooceanicola sp. C21-150M6]|uniref:chemotaxis protein CheD n=1 Tax=Pseudooceanicola sp. C21-150M6 TaxID=3434355 RepID=UPI003D7F1B30
MSEHNISITQGEIGVGGGPDTVITTILGSCVAVCLWDPVNMIGGMNHILVARTTVNGMPSDFAGVNAMELLINGIVRKGGVRGNLCAKIFGGARMVRGLSDVGQANGEFALNFLSRENISCLNASLGGTTARQIKFYPGSGRAMQKTVSAIPQEEIITPPVGNGMELF